MSKGSRKYVNSHHRASLERHLTKSKFHPESMSLPNRLESSRLKRASRISYLRSDGKCNTVRDYVIRAFEREDACSMDRVAALITEQLENLRGYEEADACTLILRSNDFSFNPNLESFSSLYYEFDIYDKVKCIVMVKNVRTWKHQVESD